MNAIDLLAIVMVTLAVIVGWRSGAIPQITGLVGALIAVIGGIELLVLFRDSLDSLPPGERAVVALVALFAAMTVGEAIGSALGAAARYRLGHGLLDTTDRAAGSLLGAVQSLLLIWLLGGLLAVSSAPSLNDVAARSTTLKALGEVLPPPGTLSEGLRSLLARSGLPDLFVGLEPPPAPALPTPAQNRADAIASSAERSTVEVAADACGFTLTGTGFAIAPGYVVTNAHVIAGERVVVVRIEGASYDAVPVLFDPAMDVAVLHVPDLRAPALHFADALPSRGTEAAALGHPDGGPLTVIPAVVTGSYDAQGRDLYGSRIITREIVELRANVQRGDSGGPLVLSDGSVGGIVFAASRTNTDVGYALSASQVGPEAMQGVGLLDPVSPGSCVQ